MANQFWFVQKIGGCPAMYQHRTQQSAINEAKRLAGTIGGEYLILRAEMRIKAFRRYEITEFQEDPSTASANQDRRAKRLTTSTCFF